jgi:hypothetical protein
MGSTRAPRVTFRGLAESSGAREDFNRSDSFAPMANREGAVGSTRGACGPPGEMNLTGTWR